MGGGKGGGGGASIPDFVVDAQAEIADRSRQLFDLTRPALQTGAGQLSSLLQTGGVGARVPIIQNAERAQRAATSNAQLALSGLQQRAGAAGLSTSREGATTQGGKGSNAGTGGEGTATRRLRERIARRGAQAEARIGPSIAAPLGLANITSALTSGQTAQQGFSAGLQALAAGRRIPTPSANRQAAFGRLARGIPGLFGSEGEFPINFGALLGRNRGATPVEGAFLGSAPPLGSFGSAPFT